MFGEASYGVYRRYSQVWTFPPSLLTKAHVLGVHPWLLTRRLPDITAFFMPEGLLSVQYCSLSEENANACQRSVAGYAHGMAGTHSVAIVRLTDVPP